MKTLTIVKSAIVALVGVVLVTSSAEAARRTFNLDYRGQAIRGGQALYIKRDIERMYGVDTRNMEFVGVSAQVKSIDRIGSVQVRAGRSVSERRAVYTRPGDWINPADWSYDLIQLYPPYSDSFGEWTFEFSGNLFKVNRVAVEVEDYRRPTPGPGPVPRPRPRPGPGPRPGERYAELNCLSENYRPAQCPVNFRVTEVVLLQQFSDARGACIEGQTYFADSMSIQVSGGCRGRFGIYGY